MRSARSLASALILAVALAPVPAFAQGGSPAPAPAAPQATPEAPQPATTPAGSHYTTADTNIGTLLDDPAARAILVRHLPDLIANEQINMARGMTLRAIQAYAAEVVTNEKLDRIDQELAALPARH